VIRGRLPVGIALVAAGGILLSGCAAAVVAAPLAAGAGVFKASKQSRASKRERARQQARPAPKPGQVYTAADGSKVEVTTLTALPPPSGAPPAAAIGGNAPPAMQYLYGSGEAAAISMARVRLLRSASRRIRRCGII
jgi:hypothetical protein